MSHTPVLYAVILIGILLFGGVLESTESHAADNQETIFELKDNEIDLPDFYRWRTTGGCYFCPFQRRSDWMGLKRNHPDLFAEAKRLEQKHGHGTFTWNQLYSLEEIEAQKELPMEIEERDIDEFEDQMPCSICAK